MFNRAVFAGIAGKRDAVPPPSRAEPVEAEEPGRRRSTRTRNRIALGQEAEEEEEGEPGEGNSLFGELLL